MGGFYWQIRSRWPHSAAAFYFKPTLWVSRWRAWARAFFYNPHQDGLNIGRMAKSKWHEPLTLALKIQVIVEYIHSASLNESLGPKMLVGTRIECHSTWTGFRAFSLALQIACHCLCLCLVMVDNNLLSPFSSLLSLLFSFRMLKSGAAIDHSLYINLDFSEMRC